MKRKPVSSSNIVSVGYDDKKLTLEVEFSGGGVYTYSGVPKKTYDGLMKAESVGSFFHKNVKTQFAAKKVDPEE